MDSILYSSRNTCTHLTLSRNSCTLDTRDARDSRRFLSLLAVLALRFFFLQPSHSRTLFTCGNGRLYHTASHTFTSAQPQDFFVRSFPAIFSFAWAHNLLRRLRFDDAKRTFILYSFTDTECSALYGGGSLSTREAVAVDAFFSTHAPSTQYRQKPVVSETALA